MENLTLAPTKYYCMQNRTTEIKWAVIFIAVSILWMWGEKLAGLHGPRIAEHEKYSMFFILPAVAIYVMGLHNKRIKDYGGYMTWKQGFVAGFFITLFVTVVTPLTQWFTLNVISPEYFPNVINYSVAKGELTQEQAADHFSLKNYILLSTGFSFVMGILTSAFVALLVKRTRPATVQSREGVPTQATV